MARKSVFFTDGDELSTRAPGTALEINYWYSLGVSHTRLDNLSGTESWPINRENTVRYVKLNQDTFKERQRMLTGYLEQFNGDMLVKPLTERFLVNMSEGRLPRLDAQGKLCGVSLIVLHYTGTKTKKPALNTFESGIVVKDGKENINTGAHFLIDENGKIIELAPLGQIVMHAKGFNLQSIEIGRAHV